MSARPAAPPAAWAEAPAAPPVWRRFGSRIATLCLVELRKVRHDRTELYTRAVQPALWLLIFGETFTRLHAIPTGDVPYLDYLAPGIMAQSALFIAIFYGIQIIWERDAGILAKLLTTPTPRAAWSRARRSRPGCGPSARSSSSWPCRPCSAWTSAGTPCPCSARRW